MVNLHLQAICSIFVGGKIENKGVELHLWGNARGGPVVSIQGERTPRCHSFDETTTTTAGHDCINIPSSLYSVDSVFAIVNKIFKTLSRQM